MSSQPPPNPIVSTFNPAFWGETDVSITEEYLEQNYLQFPFAQGNETFGGISVNSGADFNGVMTIDNTATFSVQPLNTATQPSATDSSTKMPTTAWVQSAINNAGGEGSSLLSSSNTWTNTNTFSAVANGTKPGANSNGVAIPTTSWVNTAITNAIANITPTTPTSVVWNFDRDTDATFTLPFPVGVQNYSIVVQAPGGYAGAGTTTADPIGGDIYIALGGMGGGGGGNGGVNIPNTQEDAGTGNPFWSEDGETWTATYTASTGLLILSSTSGNYVSAYAGGNGADTPNAIQTQGGFGGTAGAGGPALYNWTNGVGNFLFNGTAGTSGANGVPVLTPNNLTTTTGLLPPYVNTNPAVPPDPQENLYTDGRAGSTTDSAINNTFYSIGGLGCGQWYAGIGSPDTLITNTTYYGFEEAPKGKGQINLAFSYNIYGQVGGTNRSFIAYDDPDPATKTKQIYTDKEGLAISQDMNTAIKTTTLTPTDLKYDDGTLIQATIQDIINTTNNPDTDTLQSVLNNYNTAYNADLILITSAIDQQIKLTGTSANGIQITNPSTGAYPYCVMGISGFSQGGSATTTLQASNNLVRVYNNTLGNPAETSIRSGVSTLGETNITAQSNGVGYSTTPTIQVFNTNSTAGNTTGVPSIEFYKSGRNGAINDVVSSIQFNAKDGAGTKRTFGKIESTITSNTAPSNYDGALDFYSLINGVNNLVFRLNGADNENNSFRPLDLNGNELKTSQGDMLITTTASSGTGDMSITAKGGLSISTNTDLTMNVGTNLNFNGAGLQSNTATGNSGEHLVIYLNGVQYKIKLENP